MDELKRVRLAGRAVPVRGNDIDTDRIIPARYLRCVTFDGIGVHAFEDDRKQLKEKGKTHPFDEPKFAGAKLLFVNKNFGCGSSREHAPQSIMRWGDGITAIVGESFAEIFYGNCFTLGIPCVVVDEAAAHKLQKAAEDDAAAEFTIDLSTKKISWKGGEVSFEIPEGPRQAFLEGRWDSTAELLAAGDKIDAMAKALPYFGGFQ